MNATWQALRKLVDNLIELRGQLAMLQVAERTQRLRQYAASAGESVSARDREADFATMELANEITSLKAEIHGKEDLRDMLVLAVEHDVEVV